MIGNIRFTLKKLVTGALALAVFAVVSTTPVSAQFNFFGGGGGSGGGSGGGCGSTQTHLISCDGATGVAAIGDLIRIALFVMTILIGLVATGGLAYAAVLYASSRDDQERVRQAKAVIRNVILGLIFYAFTVAIVAWLIPGSVIEQSATPDPTASPSPTATP